MQKNRSRSRGFLFQKLYSMCFHTIDEKTFKESFYDDQFTFEIDEAYVSEMIKIIPEKESFFIEVIETYSPRFKIRHMSVLYLLPIYIALAEMFYFSEEIPAKVSINEGIEMAKMYGDDSAKKMVNGVLNSAFKDVEKLTEKSKNLDTTIQGIFKR